MAGRGTDILLGGNPTSLTNDLIKELFEDKDRFNNNEFIKSLKIEDPDFLENLRLNYKDLLKTSLSELEEKTDPTTVLFLQIYNFILNEQKRVVIEEGKSILDLGGLHVIGTERHESRRIDNQLRGRAGRQGDPGSSRFFLCLEDKLLRIFGGEQILNIMQNVGFQDDTPIQSGLLNKSLELSLIHI